MENEKKFKTKTGFCNITAEKIILTRDGVIGNVSNKIVGKGISKIILIYSGISFYFLYTAYKDFEKGDKISGIFYSLFAIFIIYGILKSLNNSATPIIERNRIKEAKFINGKAGLTRSRFEILFDENGKVKKRIIMLPGTLNDGQNETEKALKIMKEEKIIA